MNSSGTEKEKMRQWVENWRIVDGEIERLRLEKLRTLTEAESAAQFNELDCDPALVWAPPERRQWSGLIEQQRLFAQVRASK